MYDCMTFPKTVDEFMESYKIVDSKQIYTNGTELVPIFRMKQWFEHLSEDVQPVIRCKNCIHYMPYDWMFSEIWQSQNIDDYPQNEIGCEWVDHYVNPDDYCSLGERKDDEQDEID